MSLFFFSVLQYSVCVMCFEKCLCATLVQLVVVVCYEPWAVQQALFFLVSEAIAGAPASCVHLLCKIDHLLTFHAVRGYLIDNVDCEDHVHY